MEKQNNSLEIVINSLNTAFSSDIGPVSFSIIFGALLLAIFVLLAIGINIVIKGKTPDKW